MSNLLNQRFITLNEAPELELPTSHAIDENDKPLGLDDNNYVKIDNEKNIDSTVSVDPEVDTNSTPYQDEAIDNIQEPTMTNIINEPSTSLDEIEAEMELKDDVIEDILIESTISLIRSLNESVIELERESIKLKVSQYNILNESITEDEKIDKMVSLRESAGKSMWETLIDWITKAIEKIKEFVNKYTIIFLGKFDLYGKWARKYEDELKAKQKDISDIDIEITNHEWNENILFSETDIKLAFNAGSQILGNASTVEDMKKKIDEYESRKWDNLSIYKSIVSSITKANVGDASSISDIHKVVLNSIRKQGAKKSIKMTATLVNKYIDDMKKMKSVVGKIAVSSKEKMSKNSDLERILNDCKLEAKKYAQYIGKTNDTKVDDDMYTSHKYYKLRYNVASIAQQVVFDMYRLKMMLLKEFADEKKRLLTAYLNTSTQEESIDYLAMSNNGVPEYSYVLNEIG